MTGTELQKAFATHLNQLDSPPTLHSDDIFHWLNRAQESLVNAGIGEMDRERRLGDVVTPLMSNADLYTYEDSKGNDVAVLPTNYRYPMSVTGKVIYSRRGIHLDDDPHVDPSVNPSSPREHHGRDKKFIRIIRVVQHDDVNRMLDDPFNTTTYKAPLSVIHRDKIVVYNDPTFFVNTVFLEYIREPGIITRDKGCELPAHYHYPLVEQAVNLFIQSIGNIRQPATQQNNE